MRPIASWLARPALLRTLFTRLRLAARLLREPAVPLPIKALTLLPLVYVLSPIDVLPDLLPLLGQLDDLGVVLLAIEGFLGLCPTHAVDFHRRAIEHGRPYVPAGGPKGGGAGEGRVIDAEFRREP
jgi:uncharacterized membrane protein YkvA (DUF1232 family)